MVRQVDDVQEFRELINSEVPVVVDFTATWCGPCQMISPVFNKLAQSDEYKGIVFIKVDIDQNDDAAEQASISVMPT